MPRQHVKLPSPYCLLCRHHIIVYEKTIMVLGAGTKYRGCTSSFHFPGAQANSFACVTVYVNRTRKNWRLCRHTTCPVSEEYPRAFAFHVDCIRLFTRHVSTLEEGAQPNLPSTITDILSCSWSLGLWSYPGAFHDTPKLQKRLQISLDSAVESMVLNEWTRDFCCLMENIARLPVELCTLIMFYSPDSALWRFARVLAWQSEPLECLWNKTIHKLLPNTLDCWIRHDLRTKSSSHIGITEQDERRERKYFRMGIDDLGIQTIEFLESRTALPNSAFPSSPWYIVEDVARLDDFNILSNCYFTRVEPCQSQASSLMLWNTPSPPDFFPRQTVQNSKSRPNRLGCVTLDRLTGLSVFCAGGRTYGIHAHTLDHPSAVDAYQRISLHQDKLVWLYFPLARGEAIREAWVRQRDEGLRWTSDPILVVKTTRGRVFTFGPYITPDNWNFKLCNLSNGDIAQLIHDDPEAGDPILYFGAHCRLTTKVSQGGPLERLEVPDEWFSYGQFFYSYASLENVERVCLFLDQDETDWKQLGWECCVGILLTYKNGSQEALGQCRMGLSATTEILHPITFHWKENSLGDNVYGVNVRFSSIHSRFQASDELGWTSVGMEGGLEWWFNHEAVVIVSKP